MATFALAGTSSAPEDRPLDNSFWRPAVRAQLGGDPIELAASHSPTASVPEGLAKLLAARCEK